MTTAHDLVRTLSLAPLVLGANLAAQAAPQGASTIAPAVRKAIIEQGKQHSQVMAHLDHLANRIGPRLTSSSNLTIACEWARDRFRSFGIENAHLEKWGSFPVGFDRGGASGEITAPKDARQPLHFCTNAWSAGTRGRQEGEVAAAPTSAREARQRAAELAGKWLLTGRSSGASRILGGGGNRKLHAAFRAAGVLGLIQPSRSRLLVTSGNYRIRYDRLPELPIVNLRKDEFEALHKRVAGGEPVRVAFDIRNYFRKGPIPLYNVIADIQGTEKPDEFVVVGGHIDSWDGATGTTDNGTGTSTTLEAARILMKVGAKPKRTIRFMLWSGEEQGLMGSRAWCGRHRKLVREKVSAALIHDMGTGVVIGAQGFKKQLPYLRRAFADFDKVDANFPFELSEATGVMPGSDHFSFFQLGAPGIMWLQTPAVNYTRTHHTQFDTFDAAKEDHQKQTATIVALGALGIANLDVLLPRPPKDAKANISMPISLVGIRLGKSMLVTKVTKGGRGEQMGLRVNDKLRSFNGKKLVGGEAGFMRAMVSWAMSGKPKGKMVLERNGKKVEFSIPNPMASR